MQARQDAEAIVGIAGNWDAVAAESPELMRALPWTYLENETALVQGLHVFGSPLALPFGAFPFMASEERLAEVWATIEDDVDLLVIHGPAYGLGDTTEDGRHAGSRSLLDRLDELPQLQALVCGHIHEAAGQGEHGNVRWFNAAMVQREGPLWFELTPRQIKRTPGLMKGQITIKPGADEVPEGFEPFVE
jgi:Icc-related predicted phosphoesterase